MRVPSDKPILKEHIPSLERLCKITRDKGVFIHAQALLLRSQGKTLKQIRETLGVPEATVKYYTKRLKQEGVRGLFPQKQKGGNRSFLNSEQEAKLKELLAKSEAWLPEQITYYLQSEFEITYADNSHSVIALMKRLGFVRDTSIDKAFMTVDLKNKLQPLHHLPKFSPGTIAFFKRRFNITIEN
jgi:transposase